MLFGNFFRAEKWYSTFNAISVPEFSELFSKSDKPFTHSLQ